MTPEEFEKIAGDWLATAKHPGTGRLYTEMVYQPMLELLAYLRANGFKTYIVSGGGVEFNLPEELLQVGRVSMRVGYTAADSYGKNYEDKTLDTLGLSKASGWAFGS